jgi:hypothetical protein
VQHGGFLERLIVFGSKLAIESVAKLAAGAPTDGRPYGYVDGSVADAQAKKIVRQIFGCYADGKRSRRGVFAVGTLRERL